jgi:hypothetical protein
MIAPTGVTKRIFQVTYSERLFLERAAVLRRLGYSVLSVIGNESAKAILSSLDLNPELFIVGYEGPEHIRQEMVEWLKNNFPSTKVIALNPSNQQLLRADHNTIETGPEKWLPLISTP